MRKIIKVKSIIDKDVMQGFDKPREVRMAYDWLIINHQANMASETGVTISWYVVESTNHGLTLFTAKSLKELKGPAVQWVYKSEFKVLLGQLPGDIAKHDCISSEYQPTTKDRKYSKIALKGFDYMRRYMEGK